MGLDIWTQDKEKNFHIGYISFSNMRACFLLSHDEELYFIYNDILRNISYNAIRGIQETKKKQFKKLKMVIGMIV